ncbi:Severe Depolymerization of Actin [Coemansia sp. Benny D115]|nr:Severe Depolymerization of Actin [Coemansia sp. Benny D115]
MGRKNRSANLLNNLPQLQNLIKRDPQSYQDEFNQQLHHFEASLAIFELKPDEEAKDFGALINFLSQVAKCYPKESANFPSQLIDLVQKHYPVLNADLRKSIVQALILLRSRGVVSNLRVMPLFFTLFRCHDKALRKLLYTHIVNDVKNANKGQHRNHKLNKALQGFMYTMITAADAQDKHGDGALAAKKSLDVCIDLYRKNVWNDSKAVNVIAQACFSPIPKIMMTAVQFFLNPQKPKKDGDESGSEDEDEDAPKIKSVNLRLIQHQSNVNRKTKSRKRRLERASRIQRRAQALKDEQLVLSDPESDAEGNSKRKNGKKVVEPQANFDVLSLIHDPQGFVEKLFARVNSATNATKRGGSTVDRFEVRLILLKLISRLIGHHQLQLVAFYPFFQRYLQPHQLQVTQILAILATATNTFTPPDVLQPLIRAIANNFVSDHCAPEVMCAGLNTIRAIAFRQPLAVEPDLLNDLVMYRKHRDKGVMMAARSLLMLYRDVNPEMLHRRDRGREATINIKNGVPTGDAAGFAEARVAEGVSGIELLEMYEQRSKEKSASKDQGQGEEGAGGSESESGWIDSDGEGDSDAAGGMIEFESDSDEGEEDEEEVELDSDEEEEVELGSDEEEGFDEDDIEEEVVDEDDIEEETPAGTTGKQSGEAKQRIDTTRFLTNEDFDKIDRLKKRQRNGQLKNAGANKKGAAASSFVDDEAEDDDSMDIDNDSGASSNSEDEEKEYVDDEDILGEYHTRRRRRKATHEERFETARAAREGREKHGSKKSKREKEGRSLSNREKRKTKNFAMVAHKRSNVAKGKKSIVHKRHDLRRHITKQKKKGF